MQFAWRRSRRRLRGVSGHEHVGEITTHHNPPDAPDGYRRARAAPRFRGGDDHAPFRGRRIARAAGRSSGRRRRHCPHRGERRVDRPVAADGCIDHQPAARAKSSKSRRSIRPMCASPSTSARRALCACHGRIGRAAGACAGPSRLGDDQGRRHRGRSLKPDRAPQPRPWPLDRTPNPAKR